ncbi:vacuolar protein sorting-associated protein 18, partial [Phenoliferia sp. Uapishka_3]
MDEYVSSSRAPDSALALPVQGFEGGNGPAQGVYGHDADPDDAPQEAIFSLGRVQLTLASPLHSLSCSSNILIVALTGLPRSSQSTITLPPQLIRVDLDLPSEVEQIDLPLPLPTQSTPTTLHKIHVDPTGRHALISTITGDNYYCFIGTLPTSSNHVRKPRILQRLKGALIESVSWNSSTSSTATSASTSFSTREILLGTATGQIIETCLLDPHLAESTSFSLPVPGRSAEKYVKHIYTLPERQAITGMNCEVWGKRAALIITTSTRIYQLVMTLSKAGREDEGSLLEAALVPYTSGEAQPKSLELPGEPINSELHIFAPLRTDSKGNITGISLPRSVAWLTGPGIYHGSLTFPSPSSDHLHPGDGIIESASLVPYPAEPSSAIHISSNYHEDDQHEGRTEVPISMALTEWHFVLLYEDRIRVIGLLSDKVVWEEALDLPPGVKPLRLVTDTMRKTCWMFTDQSIYEIVIKDEDRDVWKIYLGRNNWELARRYAKTPRQRDKVLAAEADAYFTAGKYIQAAQSYAQSSKAFEEVVLSFVDKNERDALRYYLVAKLERLRRTDLTQRMMLATWLVEIFLSKINQLEDVAAAERASDDVENFKAEQGLMEDDMRQFLSTYKDNLDPKTVFDLLASHGRDAMTLYFASVVGDHERIITHWVLEENWVKAIEALSQQDDLDLYYRFAPVLVRHAPLESTQAFTRRPDLDVRRLIPSFSTPRRPGSSDPSPPPSPHVTSYLQYAILELSNTDSSVHNTLLTLYATSSSPSSEPDLLQFLATSPDNPETGTPCYDLDYALRLCRSNKRVQACVMIYSKMGLFEASVDLALENDDLELAKICAEKSEEDDGARKKLWLKIARYVVGKKNDIKTAMRFLESTDLLKIEDILPFFPDFVVIDDFKDEICTALEGYSAHIERLKEDMDEATRSAEAIKADIADLRNRFVVVDAAEKCGSCGQQLLTRQFYVFPCQHAFHADCLINEVTKHLSPTSLRRMLDLQSQLAPSTTPSRPRRGFDDPQNPGRKLAVASVQGLDQLRKLVLPDALLGIMGNAIPGAKSRKDTSPIAMSGSAKKEAGEKQELREQLDDLLASSCVLCEGAIASIERPFLDYEGETL